MHVCFVFERACAPRHFPFGKWHPIRKLLISTWAFQGPRQWPGGMEVIAFVASKNYKACCFIQNITFNCWHPLDSQTLCNFDWSDIGGEGNRVGSVFSVSASHLGVLTSIWPACPIWIMIGSLLDNYFIFSRPFTGLPLKIWALKNKIMYLLSWLRIYCALSWWTERSFDMGGLLDFPVGKKHQQQN